MDSNMDSNAVFERNLKRFRRWLCENAVARVVNGFLPTFLDDHSRKLKVVVDDSLQPCTDGETIVVSLIDAFLEEDYSEEEWLLVLKAATAHEAQHVNSSNFSDVKEIREWYGKYLADNYKLDSSIGESISGEVLNIVEDGRIERIAVARRPGMFKSFLFLNEAIRNGTAIAAKSDTPAGEYKHFMGNILSYAKTGLCSPGAEAYAGSAMEANYFGVQSLIDDGIASNDSTDCRNFVQELLEDAAPYIVDLIKKDPQLEKSLTKKKSRDEYTSSAGQPSQGIGSSPANNPLRRNASPFDGSSGQQSQDPQSVQGPQGSQSCNSGGQEDGKEGPAEAAGGKDSPGSQKKPKQEEGEKSLPNQDGNTGKTGTDSASAKSGGHSKNSLPDKSQISFSDSEDRDPPLSSDDLEEMKRQMNRELTAANNAESASKNQADSDAPSEKDIESICACYTGQTLPVNYGAVSITGTSELPAELKAQALSLRREITRIKESKNRSHKGLRRGTLDTGALWKTGLREDAIFQRKGNQDSGSVVFYLLEDNSGSMADPASKDRPSLRKYQAARQAAAVVEEAVRGIVPCKIALFDQSASKVNHRVIRGFDEKRGSNRSWNSLTTIGPGGCNMDSVNIRISALELSHRPERKKVLLVLSDGDPSAYGSRSEAWAEVRQAVTEARRKGIIVIPIMFGDKDFLNSSKETYELMYEKHIIACVPQEITTRLCSLFRQVICR